MYFEIYTIVIHLTCTCIRFAYEIHSNYINLVHVYNWIHIFDLLHQTLTWYFSVNFETMNEDEVLNVMKPRLITDKFDCLKIDRCCKVWS